MHFHPVVIKQGGINKKQSTCRPRPGLKPFLDFCIQAGFEIVFWSCVAERNLDSCFQMIREYAPGINENCLRFAQEMCDECEYKDPKNPSRRYFLKRLARLVDSPHGLLGKGATIDNCLLIDDTSYKNILNNPYLAVYPPTCTTNSEKKLKPGELPYLERVLIPFLQELLLSGLTVPKFCEAHTKVGSKCGLHGDKKYNQFIHLIPGS